MQEPSHRLAREVAAEGPWAAKIGAVRHPPRHDAAFYYELLKPHCASVDVWRTTYHHPLAGGHAAVVEWFKGSALRPYLAPLDEAEKAAYLEALPGGDQRSLSGTARWQRAAAVPTVVRGGESLIGDRVRRDAAGIH